MRVWFVLLGLSAWGVGGAYSRGEDPPEPKPPLAAEQGIESKPAVAGRAPTQEEVEAWVRELDADRFLVRENATIRLSAAGTAAVAPLLRSLEGASLEASVRAILVLREIAKSADPEGSTVAESALRKVAAGETSSAVRARESLALLEKDREDQAIKSLRTLGAQIETWGFLNEESPHLAVIIDEAWRGTEKDLLYLKRIPRARRLDLVGPKITDQFLGCLQYVPDLAVLTLRECAITDSGLERVRSLSFLEVLVVFYAPVTDDSVKYLAELKTLRQLFVYGTEMTDKGLEVLKGNTPGNEKTAVDRRNGGLLGVAGGAAGLEESPCVLRSLDEKSAAALAGCQDNDIVVKIGDKRIRHFRDLQLAISSYRAGQVAKLLIVRGDSRIVMFNHAPEVPFGIEWEPAALGIRVTRVTKGSPADNATILVGDLIHGFDDETVLEGQDWTRLYEATRARSTGIALIRNAEVLTKDVTLQKWTMLPPSLAVRR